jgi:type IV fimbrial biogenesis protein FimT
MKRFDKRGFSLPELAVIVAVVAILSAIALPSIQNVLAQRRLNGVAIELLGDLTNTRAQAVGMNQWVALRIDNDHQYTVFRDINKNGTVDTGESITTKDIYPTYPGVVFSTSPGTVFTFDTNGTRRTESPDTLALTGSAGSKSIAISSAGRIKIN